MDACRCLAVPFLGMCILAFPAQAEELQRTDFLVMAEYRAALHRVVRNGNAAIETYIEPVGQEAIKQLDIDEAALADSKVVWYLPRKRYVVPPEFAELYRRSPTTCLAMLVRIAETSPPSEAQVAILYGLAGDKPLEGQPLFAMLDLREFDQPQAGGRTWRKIGVDALRNKLREETQRPGEGR